MYDIIIVGGGPAGLTAAIYGLRADKTVLILEKETAGGQITLSPLVENIPGFSSISGAEYADRLVEQVLAQGAEMDFGEVTGITDGEEYKTVRTDFGNEYQGRTIIIATGARHRRLGLPDEEKFIGNGISYCAVCDGAFYKDRTVALVGGGNSALVEAVMLAGLVKKLYILQDLPYLTAEQKMQDRLRQMDNVEILTGVKVEGFRGQDELTGVTITHRGELKTLDVDGLFVAIGTVPQNEAFAGLIGLNEQGYAEAQEDMKTKTAGIFVAGDCRAKRVRQVVTAASDGAQAALAAVACLDSKNQY